MRSGSPASNPASERCRSAYCSAGVAVPWMAEPDPVMPVAPALPYVGRNYDTTSMPALHEQSGIAQRRGQALFDQRRFGPRYALQMQRRPAEELEATAQHAARGAYPCLVLIEACGGRIARHAHVDSKRLRAAVAVIEQHQVDIGRAAPPRGKAPGDLIGRGQPLDMAHRQPIGNCLGCPPPQPLQRLLDIGGELTSHPQLMDAMGTSEPVTVPAGPV